MDYNFNLKASQKKFKMPFLQPGVEHCFSSSRSLNGNPCMPSKLHVGPFINFISGLNPKTINCQPESAVGPLPSRSFSCTSNMSISSFPSRSFTNRSMSVSCVVGGLVGSDCGMKNPQDYCGNLFEVLLKEYSPNTSQDIVVQNSPENMKQETKFETQKRTYAEVTKEKPKPREISTSNRSCTMSLVSPPQCSSSMENLKGDTKSCDNITVQMPSVGVCQDKEMWPNISSGINKECSETYIIPGITKLKPSSSSSDSSETDKSISRTLSECSVESDDSFIVFLNDDEGTYCDISDEESSDEDDDISDEAATLSPSSEKLSLSADESFPLKNNKKVVKWKDDRELVKVHPLVAWDFASRAARVGPWEKYRLDGVRFQKRILEASSTLNPILDPTHRLKVFAERFASP